ncbi:MAG: hypothetical protein QM539_02125 [Alphaproteobacteria bacterium]|nr:hypothetical protein [Alphaproteobacteria bacterium]
MKLCAVIFVIINACALHTLAQYSIESFPDGEYLTYEAFKNKKPNATNVKVMRFYHDGFSFEPIPETVESNQVVLKYANNLKKIKNTFAIVTNGQIYINTYWINKLVKNKDFSAKVGSNGEYIKVIKGGKFLYLELHYTSFKKGDRLTTNEKDEDETSKKNDAFGATDLIKTEGVILDIINDEFDIFKTCSGFYNFISQHKLTSNFNCNDNSFTINNVRKIISEIIH